MECILCNIINKMETSDQHLKAMLEMTFNKHSANYPVSGEQKRTKTTRDEEESPESTHKMINKVHKLEKDVLYWQDKVKDICLILSVSKSG